MKRWCEEESDALDQIRDILADELRSVAPNVEVIGDRPLLRFFRGHGRNVETACRFIKDFITWRKNNDVDAIRDDIVNGRLSCPSQFPGGDVIMKYMPGTVYYSGIFDKALRPVTILRSDFSLSSFFEEVGQDLCIRFCIYCMEYLTLIYEQLAEERERAILTSLKKSSDDPQLEPYGVILQACVIRDLEGFSYLYTGAEGFSLAQNATEMMANNYPEVLGKLYIANSPFIFNAFFWALKAFLPSRTIENIILCGYGEECKKVLREHIDSEALPPYLGGSNTAVEVPFEFDTSEEGLLSLPENLRALYEKHSADK